MINEIMTSNGEYVKLLKDGFYSIKDGPKIYYYDNGDSKIGTLTAQKIYFHGVHLNSDPNLDIKVPLATVTGQSGLNFKDPQGNGRAFTDASYEADVDHFDLLKFLGGVSNLLYLRCYSLREKVAAC